MSSATSGQTLAVRLRDRPVPVDGRGADGCRCARSASGQVCTFWVPEQAGYEYPQMLRSHLGKVDRHASTDEPVEGLFMLDYIYSRPDAMWSEMGMLTKLHNLWMNWLVEYEDGSYEGGYAWRGRPGTGFAAAHHSSDGVASPGRDAELITDVETERGTFSRWTLGLGERSTSSSSRWGRPIGRCTPAGSSPSISRGKRRSRRAGTTPSTSRQLALGGGLSGGAQGALRALPVVPAAHAGRSNRRAAARIRPVSVSADACRRAGPKAPRSPLVHRVARDGTSRRIGRSRRCGRPAPGIARRAPARSAR